MKLPSFRLAILLLLLNPVMLMAQAPTTDLQAFHIEHKTKEIQSIEDIGQVDPVAPSPAAGEEMDYGQGKMAQIYPNLVKEELTVNFPGQSQQWHRVRVLDNRSQVVKVLQRKKSGNAFAQVDLTFLNPGIYYLELWSPKGWVKKKIVKAS